MGLAGQIARNTAVQLAGRAVSILLALFVVAIMARALGPEGFGGYSTIIAFLQFFGITVDFGLTLTANRMLGALPRSDIRYSKLDISNQISNIQYPISADRLMSNLMTLRLVSAIVFIGIAPLVALLFPYPAEVKQAMFLTTLSFLAIIMGQTLVPVFQNALRMGYVVVSELAGRVVLLGGVALAAYFHAGLLWFMAAIVAGSAVQYLVTQVYVRQFIRWHFAFDREVWRRIITVSWPIGVSIIFNLIYLKADTIILSVVRSQAEVGFYGAAYRILDQLTAVATMFIGLVLPPLTAAWVSRDRARFQKIYQGAFDAYAAMAFPLLVGAALIGVPLMKLVAGAEYGSSGAVLGVLMVAMVGVFFSTLFGHMVVVLEKQKQMIWGYGAVAALAVPVYLYVIPRYGMFGAAWATVGTEALITILTFAMVYRTARLAPRLPVFLKSGLASLVMGAFLYVLRDQNLAILLTGGTVVYGAALYLLGGIKKETMREIIFSSRSLP